MHLRDLGTHFPHGAERHQVEYTVNCPETCLWKQYIQETGRLLLPSAGSTPTLPSLPDTALPHRTPGMCQGSPLLLTRFKLTDLSGVCGCFSSCFAVLFYACSCPDIWTTSNLRVCQGQMLGPNDHSPGVLGREEGKS